ncbi:MAG: DUF4738 domain-containing protein [Prevotellaceae bacterium]|nr:DUF4738 domain-containing protein [Prevotellaceae bacterium]
MKKQNIIIIAVMSLVLASCGGKKEHDYIIVEPEKPVVQKPQTIASETYKMDDTVTWRGKVYTYNIVRMCDKEAPTVKNEDGQKFFDNKATITITRPDGTEFYSHTFRKASFEQYLPAELKKGGILEGVVFEKAENGFLQFAASVALPQSDEYMPFAVKISPDQSITISKVNRLVED